MSAAGFSTRAIHSGQEPDGSSGAVVVPITLSSTFVQDRIGEHRGFEYSRSGNPTRHAAETCLADLEGGTGGLCFASGLAAQDAVLRLVEPGRRVVLCNDAYGGTYRLISTIHGERGVAWTAASFRGDLDNLFDETVAMVWIETPTNPLLGIIDIRSVVEAAHRVGALVVVDNTFATPYIQQPLSWGADIVVHSATKYLGGHSDVVGGVVVTRDNALHERLAFIQNAAGAILSPFDS